MRKGQIMAGLLMLVTVGLLAGCGGAATPAESVSEEVVPVIPQGADDKVVAEAVIEPARWSELRFDIGGDVAEVLVEEGESVEAGTPLGRLGTGALELTLKEAQAALETAELRLARTETEHERQLAEAELTLQTAEDRLAQARARSPDITAAQVALQRAIRAETDAAYEYEKAENRPWEWRFEDVQRAYTNAWQNAKDNLTIARADYDTAVAEQYASSQELVILDTEVQRARLELEWLQEGIDPLLAQDVENARLQVARAQAELEAATLVAPFDGIVTKVNVGVGDLVTSGEVILVRATVDQLQARTVDLTELDVVRVVEGQPAVVTVDALPGQEFSGVVREVALQPEDYHGDVVYAITVALTDAADTPLRWGMTALVKVEAD